MILSCTKMTNWGECWPNSGYTWDKQAQGVKGNLIILVPLRRLF
jgi:hypothetical protein